MPSPRIFITFCWCPVHEASIDRHWSSRRASLSHPQHLAPWRFPKPQGAVISPILGVWKRAPRLWGGTWTCGRRREAFPWDLQRWVLMPHNGKYEKRFVCWDWLKSLSSYLQGMNIIFHVALALLKVSNFFLNLFCFIKLKYWNTLCFNVSCLKD